MPIIHDQEFGDIIVRRNAKARQIRIRVAPDGGLKASAPTYAPLFMVKQLINRSRNKLRDIVDESGREVQYTQNGQIGKSHHLIIKETSGDTRLSTSNNIIYVNLNANQSIVDPHVQSLIRSSVIKVLRLEAKSHLPHRLNYIATKHGYRYTKVRFSHAGGRWGSCSSNGTISLNIALMKLPFELIDYVLMHELAHTRQMNHSREFWHLVSQMDTDYKSHRQELRKYTPSL